MHSKKSREDIQIKMKETNCFYSLKIWSSMGNQTEPTKKLLELIHKFSQVAGYKINIQKSTYIIYKQWTNENWNLKIIPFSTASKILLRHKSDKNINNCALKTTNIAEIRPKLKRYIHYERVGNSTVLNC